MGGMGGNKAVRDWVGGGLKALGEMLEGEEESETGERAEVVREVFVSRSFRLVPPAQLLNVVLMPAERPQGFASRHRLG